MPTPSIQEMMPLFGHREVILPEERLLGSDEQVQIDLQAPLANADEMHQELGIRGNHVATVNAGSKSFMIIDVRGTNSNCDFFITDETFSLATRIGFKGVEEDEPIVIGRDHHTGRFNYPETVSRDHFEVSYNSGGLFVRNLRPTNKTRVTAHLAAEQESPIHLPRRHIIEAVRTHQVENRMQQHPNFGEKDDTAPYGYYLDHPIIGRASESVEGGVYMGGSSREAIVVDGKSIAMKQVYEGVQTELRESFARNETLPMRAILLKVMNRVQEVMPYDGPKTEDISRRHHGDQLVGISTYLNEGAGVCRHQALLAAYILENLVKDGYMTGVVGVERNTVNDLGGTHAWAVLKTRNNGTDEVIVVDPAQSFIGSKSQAQLEVRWEYRLTSDEY